MSKLNILVIDNGAANIQYLLDALVPHNITLVNLNDFKPETATAYDVVVISGSVHNAVVKKPEVYATEIDLITKENVPIIGICMGFEVIAFTYRAKFLHLKERVLGLKTISVNINHTIFENRKQFNAIENHKWSVQEVNVPLEVLATSDTGVEVIKHISKPIYGVQFHPESPKEGNDSKFILDNILKEIASQKGIK